MIDGKGRTIDYMRISITDRCNLRCRYCMPKDIQRMAPEEILTYEEIEEVCRQAAALGISKLKVTGGEPLIRKGCVSLMGKLKQIPGICQVTLTTNGILLEQSIEELCSAGVDGINISLDTLDRETFRRITGADKLGQVLDGIKASVCHGVNTKINVVLQEGVNAGEWDGLLAMAQEWPVDVRFIEMMPIGGGEECQGISNQYLLKMIMDKYGRLARDAEGHGNGPAVYYRLPGFLGSIGFISAVHEKFCTACNRIRMTADGEIKPCLCYGGGGSVKRALREGDKMEVRRILGQAIKGKPEGHCFERKQDMTEARKMVQIGG